MFPDRFHNNPHFDRLTPQDEDGKTIETLPSETRENIEELFYDRMMQLNEQFCKVLLQRKDTEAFLKAIDGILGSARSILDKLADQRDAILHTEEASHKLEELRQMQTQINTGSKQIADFQALADNLKIRLDLLGTEIRKIADRQKNIYQTVSGDPRLN